MKTSGKSVGFAWVAASVALQSAAAVCGKLGGLAGAGRGLAGLIDNPWLPGVFAALGAQAVCWMLALRRLPLSQAYPFMSLVLPLNLMAAHFLFGESIGSGHLMGTAIMIIGYGVLAGELT